MKFENLREESRSGDTLPRRQINEIKSFSIPFKNAWNRNTTRREKQRVKEEEEEGGGGREVDLSFNCVARA